MYICVLWISNVYVACHESCRSCICVLSVSNLPMFLRLDLDCSDSVIRVFFSFYFFFFLFFFSFIIFGLVLMDYFPISDEFFVTNKG